VVVPVVVVIAVLVCGCSDPEPRTPKDAAADAPSGAEDISASEPELPAAAPDLAEPDVPPVPDVPPPEPDLGPPPPPPCEAGGCAAKAWCDLEAEHCVCKPGFDGDGETCEAPSNEDPEQRTQAQVCARYNADIASTAEKTSTGGDVAQCLPGAVTRAALNDGLRRLNLYRWLAGLQPAWDRPNLNQPAQEAALMMHANNALSHGPPKTWKCYTDAGAKSAGSSNLALGTKTIPAAIDLFIADPGTPSLGHRRWCLNPPLGKTGFGAFGKGGAMHAFGKGNSYAPAYVTYPAPGPYPAALVKGPWSFSSSAYALTAETTGQVTLPSGEVAQLSLKGLGGSGFGYPPAIVLTPVGAKFGKSGAVQITLSKLKHKGEDADVTWTTTLVDCAQ